MSTIDNEVAAVIERLGNVVTKLELSGFMNIFGEPEFRNEYVLWDGEPFESDLAYSAIYGKATKTLYVIGYGTEQEKVFHCDLSSKDGGARIGSIVEIREREAYHTLVDELLKMPVLQLT